MKRQPTLGVDHEHAGGSDDDVIDVAARTWDAPIVEHTDAADVRERVGQLAFAF